MTVTIPSIPKNVWLTILAVLSVLIVGSVVVQHANPLKRDLVATAFLMDIVITIPVVYYFLLVRPLKLRKWSLFLVFSACCGIGYLILPAHQRGYILELKKLSAGLEIGIIIYALTKLGKVRASYRELQNHLPDFAYNFQKSMTATLGNHIAVKFLTTELTLLRFGLLFWVKPEGLSPQIKQYSVHRESGYATLFGVILFVGVVEVAAFHLFLNHYSHTAAIITTILSVYGLVFITGDFSAIAKSPVLVLDSQLLLRTGIRWRALVDLDNIASVEKVKDSVETDVDCFKGGLMKSSVNILFTFKEPVSVERIYRKPKTAKQILMSVDDADGFIKTINHL